MKKFKVQGTLKNRESFTGVFLAKNAEEVVDRVINYYKTGVKYEEEDTDKVIGLIISDVYKIYTSDIIELRQS